MSKRIVYRVLTLVLVFILAGCSFPLSLESVISGGATPTSTPAGSMAGQKTTPTAPLTPVPATPAGSKPAATSTPAANPAAASTPAPTQTAAPAGTPVPTLAVLDAQRLSLYRIQSTGTLLPPFVYQPGTPRYTTNFAHPDRGCNWMGVAGQVLERDGKALINQVIVIQGTLNGQAISQIGLTGTTLAYGPGGYEIELSNQVAASKGTLQVQLLDLDGKPQTPIYNLTTLADCQKNLMVINFQRSVGDFRQFLPQINR